MVFVVFVVLVAVVVVVMAMVVVVVAETVRGEVGDALIRHCGDAKALA